MRKAVSALALMGAFCFSTPLLAEEAQSHHPAHWTYDGKSSPAHWGELEGAYSACATGKSQSPIDIKPTAATHLDHQEFSLGYKLTDITAINNGHTIQATPVKGSEDSVTFKGKTYKLAQFHFHTPSEHTVTGKNYPMEVHFVNSDDEGSITVVGIFIEEGETNKQLETLFELLPADDKTEPVKAQADLASILPKDKKAIVYSGSLTTPPCTEHVNWIVMEHPIQMSKKQISAFQKLFHDNHRPVQELNNRQLTEE